MQSLPKIICDDSSVLHTLRERLSYDTIFTEVLPNMGVDVGLLEQFYSGQFEFENDNSRKLVNVLFKLEAFRLREFIFHLLSKDYVFEGLDGDIMTIVNEEKSNFVKSRNKFLHAAANGYLNLARNFINNNVVVDLVINFVF